MYENLRDFARVLDEAGELKTVSAPVSPILEITEITDRVSKSPAPGRPSRGAQASDPRFHHLGGSALLFNNVRGPGGVGQYDMPVLINAFGSYRRVEMALGCDQRGLEGLAERIGKLAKPEPPLTLTEKLRKIPELMDLARLPPKKVRSGPCQDVVKTGDEVDLLRLPMIRCWPLDGDPSAVGYPAGINDPIPGLGSGPEWERDHRGRYITLGGVHTIHADDLGHAAPPSRNIGMYRAQLMGRKHLAMHWHMHHDGARHWRSWKARGRKMPVAIALGGESVLPYAATAPMPPGLSELLLAGFLNKGGIPLVRCKTVPLDVPANAEIVIEGWVSDRAGLIGWEPGDGRELGPGAVFEGPFGDHTGFYSLPDRYPLFEVTAITHRRDPIYPTTVVGLPPQEDYFLGKATERIFLPLLRTIIPDIADYDLPMFGAFHNCALVKVKKEYPLQARRVMHSVWGAGQMAWTKSIVVVDEDVDVHDTTAVLRAVGDRCHPTRDVELVRGPVDILDHAAPFVGAGAKIGLDATRKSVPAELHHHVEGLAAELCAAGPVVPAQGEAARATEAAARALPGVVDARVPEELGGWWLFVKVNARAAGAGAAAVKAIGSLADKVALPAWIVVVGEDADLKDLDGTLFHWQANMSPERDRFLSVCGRRVAFDSTPKPAGPGAHGQPVRSYPPILRMSESVREAVSARWREYGI